MECGRERLATKSLLFFAPAPELDSDFRLARRDPNFMGFVATLLLGLLVVIVVVHIL
jgi:hypothetical protein